MDGARAPKEFQFGTGNEAVAWQKWQKNFEIYAEAKEMHKKSPGTQSALLLNLLGPQAVDIYETFEFATEADKKDVKKILLKFKNYCEPKRNTVFERYTFWSRNQNEGESVHQWVTDLKNKASTCEFGDQKDGIIRDKIVFGIRDEVVKEKLLNVTDLDLATALTMCRAAETSKTQLKAMKSEERSVDVNVLKKNTFSHNKHPQPQQYPQKIFKTPCRYCGTKHAARQCPAYGHVCKLCKKKHHSENVCKNVQRKSNSNKQFKHVNLMDSDSDTDQTGCEQIDNMFVGHVYVGQTSDDWIEELDFKNTSVSVKFKLDSGSSANVLPMNAYRAIQSDKNVTLNPTRNILTGIGDGKVKPRGTVDLECSVSRRSDGPHSLTFYVTDGNLAILGRSVCDHLNLIQRVDQLKTKSTSAKKEDAKNVQRSKAKNENANIESVTSKGDLMNDFRDVFSGVGLYDREYHIRIKDDVTPVIQATRTIPYAKQEKLKQTLDELESAGIVAPVDKPTDWVNNLVITEKKNGTMRLCLDPRPLNKAIRREHHRIPTSGDVQTRLAGKKIFTVVDMRDAFWHVKLSDESSYLCTFHTPWGRKRFLRMPFGISSASEVLQLRNDETFGDIENVYVIADDLIIAGVDDAEHDAALLKVMKRARERNVKFSANKLQYKVPEVKYMGHLISADGQCPDPEKVSAVINMPKPTDRKGVERLLDMIKYLSIYIPHESDITGPLRGLLKEGSDFSWNFEHDKALGEVKKALTTNPVLTFFDIKKEVTIQTDASQSGLGSCLMQEGKPIAYASRTLTSAEVNYAQIEKELLAIVYACRKFHPYIYGQKVVVQSDHKPLEIIMRKPLNVAPPRLQRMMLQLQRYDLQVKYVPGKEMYVADTLSRAHLETTDRCPDDRLHEDVEVMVHAFIETLPISATKKTQLQEATADDNALQQLKQTVFLGWPQEKSQVLAGAQPYWTTRDEIHEADGILFKGNKMIIPDILRPAMLKLIHESHLGAEKCKERARAVMYWPGMTEAIDRTVSQCTTCMRFRRNNQKEPMIPHKVPDRPWQKLATDIMTYKGRDYLIIVDYFSKFVEVPLLQDKTATSVILALKSVFARFGIAEELVSDNMPFGSQEFIKFTKEWGITSTTSSPTYAQSNGLAERNVQTIKQLLKKADYDCKDPYLALLDFRNTPITGMKETPAQILMGRNLRTKLPVDEKLLQPAVSDTAEIRKKLVERQEQQKLYYDRGTVIEKQYSPGDVVRVQRGQQWEPATITGVHNTPRSYIIDNDGTTLRRNTKHLQHSREPPPDSTRAWTLPSPVREQPQERAPLQPRAPPQPPDNIQNQPARTSSGREIRKPVRYR